MHTPQRDFRYSSDSNQLWTSDNINCLYESIEEAEISSGSSIWRGWIKLHDIPSFSIYLLDILINPKSNIKSGHLTGESDRQRLSTNQCSVTFHDAETTSQVSQSASSIGRGDDERVATVAPVKARRHSHGSPGDKNQATGVNNNNLNLRKKNLND